MFSYLSVAAGGAIGAVARFWIGGLIAERIGQTFPTGTLVVNVTGSFLIGLFAALTGPDARWMVQPVVRQFLMIGICGGYTTFSSFSLQTLGLLQDGEWLYASLYTLLSFALCLLGVWLGVLAAFRFNAL